MPVKFLQMILRFWSFLSYLITIVFIVMTLDDRMWIRPIFNIIFWFIYEYTIVASLIGYNWNHVWFDGIASAQEQQQSSLPLCGVSRGVGISEILLGTSLLNFFTTTTETCQNFSKWSHFSTDHNECIDLCIKHL